MPENNPQPVAEEQNQTTTPDPDSSYYQENNEETPEPAPEQPKPARKEPKLAKSPGHPRKDGMPPGSAAIEQTLSLPRPRFRTFRSDSQVAGQSSGSFHNYWGAFPTWAKDRTIGYVYRDHPALIPIPEDSKEKLYIDKVSTPFENDGDLLHRYGCGSYRIILNEPGKPAIATCFVIGVGGNDFRSNPPTDRRIDDVNQVDLNNPANNSYVMFLRSQGKLPEQSKKAEAEADMATIEMARDIAKQNEKLTDKLIESAGKRAEQDPNQKPLMDVVMDGALKSNEMMADAYTRSQSMMQETFEKLKTLREEGGSNDPTRMLELAFKLMGEMKGGPDANSAALLEEVKALRDRVANMQDERIASLERRLEEAANRQPISAPNPAVTQFTSVKEGVAALREMRDVVNEFSGGEKDSNPIEEAAADLGPKWLRPILPIAIPLIGQLAQAFFASRMPPGTGNMPGMPQQPMPFPPPMQHNPGPGSGPNPGQAPGPALVQAPSSIPGLPPEVVQILQRIDFTLVDFLTDHESNGADFAEWFIQGFGVGTFEQIRGMGEQAILGALYAYPPIATPLANIPQLNVQAFVKEFVNVKLEEGPTEPEAATGATVA